MDEDNKNPQPLFAEPYKEGDDELTPEGPRLSDLLEEPPLPPPPVAPYVNPIAAARADSDSSPIRTFQDDIARTIKSKNTSVIQIALAEARKREQQETQIKENSAGSRKNLTLITLSALLFVSAIGIAGYVLWPGGEGQDTLVPKQKMIILADSEKTFPIGNLDRVGLVSALQREVAGNRDRLGSVSRIIPVQNEGDGVANVETRAFMTLLAKDIPDSLVRSFGPDFYFGVHVFQKNEPYLILKVDSYQSAFSGMLSWENRMPYDLADIFIPAANRASTLNSRGSFRDVVVGNRDTRVLLDETTRQSLLMYSFPDKDTLVITTNERTLQEISDRVSKALLLK